MINSIVKLGRINFTLIVTLISAVISFALYFPVGFLVEGEIRKTGIIMSVLIPVLVTPLIIWIIVGLLIKIHLLEKEIRNIAEYDMLTGLMNRRRFFERAESIYKLAKRYRDNFAILYMDIDNFKNINDSYGHASGDKVLEKFGQTLLANMRDSDLVGRIGGEEFLLLLPKTDMAGAFIVSKNMRQKINKLSITSESNTIQFDMSVGIAVSKFKAEQTLEDIIHQADKALYIAKNSGKDCEKTVLDNE